jgi:hypothetical protein
MNGWLIARNSHNPPWSAPEQAQQNYQNNSGYAQR